jgi:hypothetical protein
MQFGFLDLMKTMFQQLCSKNGNARSSGRCFMEGLNQLLKLDEALIKKRKRKHLYIRPFMIATGQGVIASPSDDYKFMIIPFRKIILFR